MKYCIATGIAVLGQLLSTSVSAETVWRSTSNAPEQLSDQLEELYLSLHNAGKMPTRQVVMGENPFAELVMRQEGVWTGDYFPVEIDAMMCDMNPDICSRERIPAEPRDLRDGDSHVGGSVVTPSMWRANAGDTLIIPDLKFGSYTTLSRERVSTDWTPETATSDPALDCTKWGMDCAEVVRRYNPAIARAPENWMAETATVPVARLEVRLPDLELMVVEPGPEPVVVTEGGAPDVVTMPTSTRPPPIPQVTETMQLETLRGKLLPQNGIIRYSVTGEPYYSDQSKLFELIQHPYGTGQDLPEAARKDVMVVVLDRTPSASHCNFAETYLWKENAFLELPPLPDIAGQLPEGSAPPPCGALEVTEDLGFDDHPIGIGGLIAAQPGRHGIVGLNPYAKLVFLGLEDEQASTLNDKLTLIPPETHVANISLGVDPENNASREMRNAIEALQETVLFVVAAGNEGYSAADDCEILPACETELDNVVTVIGLNDNTDQPDLWSNTLAATNSNPGFDIGAIAAPVLTTATQNRIGWQGGTSLAAPQVAAAASLVFSVAETAFVDRPGERIAPKIVRDRLVYTADFMPGYTEEVFSGRLNVARAIDVTNVRVVLKNGDELIGELLRAPEKYTCLSETDSSNIPRNWWWIRRIVYDADRGQWLVFRNTGQGEANDARFTELERTDWCSLAVEGDETMRLRDANLRVHSFKLSEIADFTSRLFN